MRVKHWTNGANMRRDPTGFLLWKTACSRWMRRVHTTTPERVNCKQCRRYLERLNHGSI